MRKAYNTSDLAEAVLLKDHLIHNGVAAWLCNKGAVRLPAEGIALEKWDAADAVRMFPAGSNPARVSGGA